MCTNLNFPPDFGRSIRFLSFFLERILPRFHFIVWFSDTGKPLHVVCSILSLSLSVDRCPSHPILIDTDGLRAKNKHTRTVFFLCVGPVVAVVLEESKERENLYIINKCKRKKEKKNGINMFGCRRYVLIFFSKQGAQRAAALYIDTSSSLSRRS